MDASAWTVDPASVLRIDTDSHGTADEILGAWLAAAASLAAPAGARWGVAMPDPFDYGRGVALFEGVGKFEALYGVDVRQALLAGLPARPAAVEFVNDADAFVLGEWINGAATGYGRCVGMTLGTGIGSGFIADGAIVDSGPTVPSGGRAHRIVWHGLPLEDSVSRRAIRREFARAGGDPLADVREICDVARHGDPVATAVLGAALRTLGAAFGPWLRRFAAEVLVIGGSMSASWDLFEPWFLEGAGPAGMPDLRVARDAEDAGLLGAAVAATR